MPSCPKCNNMVPEGNKFCGVCGNKMEVAPAPAPAPAPSKPSIQARLILIKGEGFDGVSYQLKTAHHIIGRDEGTIIYPEDRYLSPRHADLYYEQDKLMLKDEDSRNGVFIKLREPMEIKDGDHFLAGEQLLRFEQVEAYDTGPNIGVGGLKVRFGIMPGNYNDTDPGIVVQRVSPGGSAEAAGVLAGDRLMEWNGTVIESVSHWMELMAEHAPGDVVTVTVIREDERVSVPVTLQPSGQSSR